MTTAEQLALSAGASLTASGPATSIGPMNTTYQSDVGRLRRVALKHPRDAFVSGASIDAQWKALGYAGRPDLRAATREYDAFARLLEDLGSELLFLPGAEGVGLDSIYARDASVVTDRGVIPGSMGKAARTGEPMAQDAAYRAWGLARLAAVDGQGLLEGGDVVWLDRGTLAVGQGYRTNADGIRQLGERLAPDVGIVSVPLPHFRGPHDVFHLMSVVSLVDDDLAAVYSPLMPVPFRELLLARGFELVECPDEEYDTLGCNVLAVAPRVCVVAEGSPETRRRLEAAGAEVHAFPGSEICVKGSGGPTCLARTLEREV